MRVVVVQAMAEQSCRMNEVVQQQCGTDIAEAADSVAVEPSLTSDRAADGEAMDPFGNYMEDLPVWLQRQPSSVPNVTTEPSEDQRYASVLAAALAEVASLREQLAAQTAVSQQAREDAANATAAATAAKAELLAFQMDAVKQQRTTLVLSPAISDASSTSPTPLTQQSKEATGDGSAAFMVAGEEIKEEDVPLTMQDAIDELSSISDKWGADERDMIATLKKRGSSNSIVSVDELSTLIDAKLAAAQYAFERDQELQRSRRLRSELDNVLKRVQLTDVATGG